MCRQVAAADRIFAADFRSIHTTMEKMIEVGGCRIVLDTDSGGRGQVTDNIDAYDMKGNHLWNISEVEGMSKDRYSYSAIWEEGIDMFTCLTCDGISFVVGTENPHIIRTRFPSYVYSLD